MILLMSERYLKKFVGQDLDSRKMVFIGGPRQVGKTTFALNFLSNPTEENPAYLNWDHLEHKQILLKHQLPPKQPLIILDEIHKYARWRNFLKGYYDTHKSKTKFLVTGSARLDYYPPGANIRSIQLF